MLSKTLGFLGGVAVALGKSGQVGVLFGDVLVGCFRVRGWVGWLVGFNIGHLATKQPMKVMPNALPVTSSASRIHWSRPPWPGIPYL